jgi:hypothetical protein
VILFVHGAAGGWDELIIAAVAFAVLWIAVKLAGRKPADADEEDAEADDATATADEERKTPAPPSASKPG